MSTTDNSETGNCPHCGHMHAGPCPRVKAIEYYPDGTIKRVEYQNPSSFPVEIGGDLVWKAPKL